MTNAKVIPTARLHDIGELTVINDDHHRVHHRCAMVLIFNSQEEVTACMKAGTVRLVPADDLNPEVCEFMNSHRDTAANGEMN